MSKLTQIAALAVAALGCTHTVHSPGAEGSGGELSGSGGTASASASGGAGASSGGAVGTTGGASSSGGEQASGGASSSSGGGAGGDAPAFVPGPALYCAADGDCAGACSGLGWSQWFCFGNGFCGCGQSYEPTQQCDMLRPQDPGPGKVACPDGHQCQFGTFCKLVDPETQEGGPCGGKGQCALGLFCAGDVCRPQCELATGCAVGECVNGYETGSGWGVCQ